MWPRDDSDDDFRKTVSDAQKHQFSRNSTKPLREHGAVPFELAGLVAAGWRDMGVRASDI
jgi:hypothetical protein